MQRAPKLAHEFGIRDGRRRSGVERAGEVVAFDCGDEHPHNVRDLNPAHELTSAADCSAEEQARELFEHRQCAAVSTENNSDAEDYFAHFDRLECAFPLPANFCHEVAADWATFVRRKRTRVAVVADATGLDEDARRIPGSSDRFAENAN